MQLYEITPNFTPAAASAVATVLLPILA